MINLILLPKIDSFAVGYIGDFKYSYNGFDFYFDFVNEFPQDYRIDEAVYQSVIDAELGMDSLRIASHGYIISSYTNFYADMYSLLYNGYLQLADSINYLFFGSDFCAIKFDVTYNGTVGNNNLYSWTFSCPLGSQDLVLDSLGRIPSPSDHTYTSHNNDLVGGILDDQIDNGYVYIPSGNPPSREGYKSPYLDGKSLHFFLYTQYGTEEYVLDDFSDVFIEYADKYNYTAKIEFVSPLHGLTLTPIGENFRTYTSYSTGGFTLHSDYVSGSGLSCNIATVTQNGSSVQWSFLLPTKFVHGSVPTYNISLPYSCLGVINSNTQIPGTSSFYLHGTYFNPVSNPEDIVIPIDIPVPADPVIEWPYENLPTEDPTGDPDPVEPYLPVPPIPIPVPPLPPLVSGNDDLWPDMNEVFAVESDLDSYLGGLSNFEFTPLRTLVEGFSSALIWVSTIMMALYNGSDFSILFVVLSIFFIAAALLGIYKWWTH